MDYGVSGMLKESRTKLAGKALIQTVYGYSAEDAISTGLEEIGRLESLLSPSLPQSDIGRINSHAGKGLVPVAAETLLILDKCESVSRITGGAFDITVGPLVKAWSLGTKDARIPPAAEISGLLRLVDYRCVLMNRRMGKAGLSSDGQSLDLGAVFYGYAADRVRQVYKDKGIKAGFIDLGGNIHTLGAPPGGSLWQVDLQDPWEQGKIFGSLRVSDVAVVTSGVSKKYTVLDNKRYHHILDPRYGRPADKGLVSVTVVAESALLADSLSTAFLVMGSRDAAALAGRMKDVAIVFLEANGNILVSEQLVEYFTPTDWTRYIDVLRKAK